MPNVTFSYTKGANSEQDFITSSLAQFGPGSGSVTVNVSPGAVYSLSGGTTGPGGTSLRLDSDTQIGLDDRVGLTSGYNYLNNNGTFTRYVNFSGGVCGGDTMAISHGSFSYSGCTASSAYSGTPNAAGSFRYDRVNESFNGYSVFKGQNTGAYYDGNTKKYEYVIGADGDFNDFILNVNKGYFSSATTYQAPYDTLSITSFSATTQTSSSGTPTYSTSLYWTITGGSGSFTYTVNPGGYTGTSSGTVTVTNLPQSTAGSNSPAQQTYTLTIADSTSIDSRLRQSTSASAVASVYNDNNYTLSGYPPSTTTTGKPLNALESSTSYIVVIGTIGGIDMPVFFTGSSTMEVSNNGSTWTTGSTLVTNGNTLYGRFTSLPYNTSTTPGGTNSSGLVIGQTNPQTVSFSLSSGNPPSPSIFNISTQTRAPVIQELFDAEGPLNMYPNPDIDTVPAEPNVDQYISTGIDVTNNDIEIGVEIKANDPNVQARINSGAWVNVRSI